MRLSFAITALAAVLSVLPEKANGYQVVFSPGPGVGEPKPWTGAVDDRLLLPGVCGMNLRPYGSKYDDAVFLGWFTPDGAQGLTADPSFFAPWRFYKAGTNTDPHSGAQDTLQASWFRVTPGIGEALGCPESVFYESADPGPAAGSPTPFKVSRGVVESGSPRCQGIPNNVHSRMSAVVDGPCTVSCSLAWFGQPLAEDVFHISVDRVSCFSVPVAGYDFSPTNASVHVDAGPHLVEWWYVKQAYPEQTRDDYGRFKITSYRVIPDDPGDTRLVGTYARALAPKEQLAPDTWRKYDPPELGKADSARIQALNDMMCERVDLMSTNYVRGANKTLLELPGCPSPAHRAALYGDLNGVPTLALWTQLYGDMCAWVSRDPKVETTPSSYDMVFPDRQSPLCKDIRLSASDDGIVSHDTDTYPYSLYRFGQAPAKAASLGDPQHVITDIEDMLASIADRLETSYTSDGHGVTRYQVRFDGNGQTSGTPPDPVGGYPGQTFVVPDKGSLVKEGYRFDYWESEKDGPRGVGWFMPGDTYTFGLRNDTLTAYWDRLYTLYILDTLEPTDPIEMCQGDRYVFPAPSSWTSPERGTFVGYFRRGYGYYHPGDKFYMPGSDAYVSATYRIVRTDSTEIGEALGCPGTEFFGAASAFWLEGGILRTGTGYNFAGAVEIDVTGPASVQIHWGTQYEGNMSYGESIGLFIDELGSASSGGSTHADASVSIGSGMHRLRFRPNSNRIPAMCGYGYISRLVITPLGRSAAQAVPETNVVEQAATAEPTPVASDADLEFCGFYEDDSGIPRFIDQIGPTSGDEIRWAPFYAFDRICSDLSSRNVAVTDLSPYAGYVSRARRSTYAYAVNTNEVWSWLSKFGNSSRTSVDAPEKAFAPHLEEIESTVSTNRRVSSAFATTSVTPRTPVAPSGSIVYTGNYVLEATNSTFDVQSEGTDSYGNSYVYYRRLAYWAKCVPNNPAIVFTAEPRAEIQVVAEDAGIALDTNEVFAANAAFHESPERFVGTRVTTLGRARMTVSFPDEGVTWSTNVLAHATATSATVRATAAVLDGFGRAFRVQDAEFEQFSLSPGDITFKIAPTKFDAVGYDLYEWMTVLNGSVAKTFAARDGDGAHFPQATGYGQLAEPDYSRGETYASVNYDGKKIPYRYTATFSSEYRSQSTRTRGTIIKSFTKPTVVFENEYDFTEWSGHLERVTDPTAGQGPRADYGDGDGGNEFDAYVDASFAGAGDGSAERPFATIDAAIASVNPEGGPRAVEGRVPKIGIRAGRYAFPSFFEVTVNRETPYDVRLIGIGPDVVLAKSKTSVARLEGHYVSDLRTWIENVTVECSGRHLRSFTYFVFFRCRFTGESTPMYAFIEGSGVFGSVFTNLSVYTRWEYSGTRIPFIYASQVEDCSLFLTPHPSGNIPLIEEGVMYNCAVIGGSWRRIQNKDSIGALENCTVYMPGLDEKDAPAASNCLFFADGLKTDRPDFTGNGTATAAEFKTLVDPGSLRPVESRLSWRDKGYRSYIRTY